jgi:predicted metal-dependent peptidase
MGVAPERDGSVVLFYNPQLLDNTSDESILTVLEHEGMHLLNKHIPRLLRIIANEITPLMLKSKIDIWNIAADCAVNVQAGIRKPIMINGKPWQVCLPEKYGIKEGQITEAYFLELLKKSKKISVCVPGGEGNGSGLNYGSGGLNDHKQWQISGVPDLSSLSRKVDSHIQDVIKDSLKTFSKDRGTLPSHIAELIKDALSPPKLPYYQIIRKLIKGTRYSKFKRSFTKINRKRTYVFALDDKNLPMISPFPGRTRDYTFKIVVLIDTSGSMDKKDIIEGLSGVKNIVEKDRHCHTTVLEVDAGVEKEYRVKKIRDIQFNIKGRGGTTLGPGLFRAKELNCDVCLCFTDGYTETINDYPRKKLPKKMIWVINRNGSADNVNKTGWVVHL